MKRALDPRVTRRELLKLIPVLLLGGFAVPAVLGSKAQKQPSTTPTATEARSR
jgi:hypothetical protein